MSRSDKLIGKVESHRQGDFPFAELRRYLELYGWVVVRIEGSHHRFAREGYDSLTVSVHGGKAKASAVKEARQLIKDSQSRSEGV